jgi:ATP-dependent DNA helicase HMI1
MVNKKIDEMPDNDTLMAPQYKEVEIACTGAQKRVITASLTPNSLINIVSGPGTGKTKTLCDRIAYLLANGIKPNEILVFSLTNQAVNDFKAVLVKVIGEEVASFVQISTIHSFANNVLMSNSPYWQIIRDKKTIDSTILNDILLSLSNNTQKISKNSSSYEPLPVLRSDELLNLRSLDPETYKKYLSMNYSGKKTLLKQDNVLYDKIVYEATQILNIYNQQISNNIDEFNIPFSVLEAKEIMVDEFQDISYILLEFILALSKNKQLTITGDIDQSIYAFNGASPDYNINKLIPIYKRPGYDLKEFILDETFRFSKNIHKLSLNVLEKSQSFIIKTVDEYSLPVVRQEFKTIVDEYEFIYKEIHSLIKKSEGFLTPKNFAILSITNQSLNAFQTYFENKKSPYRAKRLVSSQSWLETKISSLISFLKILDNPHNDSCLLVAISFINLIGPAATLKFKNEADFQKLSIYDYFKTNEKAQKKIGVNIIENLDKIIDRTDRTDPSSIIMSLINICELFNYSKQLSTDNLMKNYSLFLQGLYDNLKILSAINGPNEDLLSHFVSNYQSEFYKESDGQAKDTNYLDEFISLSTIHSAKGLQWDVVFIMSSLNFINDNIQTINSRTKYVGVTRARHLLYYNKSVYDNDMYIDTLNKSLVDKNMFKTYHSKNISDYIPELNKFSAFNDLSELPKFGEPIGIKNNKTLIANLLSNMHKRQRSKLSVTFSTLNKNITKLSKKL